MGWTGETGLIAFDTHYNTGIAQKVFDRFREVTGITKPVHTVIYSHHHPDQHSGTAAYVSPEDVSSGKINVIAHSTFMENLALEGGFVSPIMSQRGVYAFGALLDISATGFVNQGVGTKNETAFEDRAKGTFTAAPTITFNDKMTVKPAISSRRTSLNNPFISALRASPRRVELLLVMGLAHREFHRFCYGRTTIRLIAPRIPPRR